MRRALRLLLALAALALLAAGWLWQHNFRDGVELEPAAHTAAPTPATLARGAYLARIGNCLACHTARGGAPGAGGLPIATEFGTVYTSNLTPDDATGIGRWSAAAFWRALHHGRSADGRLLVPVFPYTHTTLLARADVDALYAYFQSLPATHAPTPAPALRWPYGTQAALAVWRALYFKPGELPADPAQDARWNLGRYLVRGVAHCSACHATRDRWGGADWANLGGGPLRGQGWYAPSLLDPAQASVAHWPEDEVRQLLRTGVAPQGRASGPMAEVVLHGTQYLRDEDLDAMVGYLRSLPPTASNRSAGAQARRTDNRLSQIGARRYAQHCADCHGAQGQGRAGAYPALAGNRAVTLAPIDNLLQTVLYGGFNAATAGNPRPYGMPPFLLTLSDAEIAAVLTHIRTAWGNQGSAVTPLDVHALRATALRTTRH